MGTYKQNYCGIILTKETFPEKGVEEARAEIF